MTPSTLVHKIYKNPNQNDDNKPIYVYHSLLLQTFLFLCKHIKIFINYTSDWTVLNQIKKILRGATKRQNKSTHYNWWELVPDMFDIKCLHMFAELINANTVPNLFHIRLLKSLRSFNQLRYKYLNFHYTNNARLSLIILNWICPEIEIDWHQSWTNKKKIFNRSGIQLHFCGYYDEMIRVNGCYNVIWFIKGILSTFDFMTVLIELFA